METELNSIHDLQKLCRLCMETGCELYSIYDITPVDEMGLYIQLLEMIMECTSLNIDIGDGLPESICMECFNYLSTSYNFKLLCERSDKKLKECVVLLKEATKKDSELDNKDDIQIEINEETVDKKVITEKNQKNANVELTNNKTNIKYTFKTNNCGICFKNFPNTTLLKAHLHEHSIEMNGGKIQRCNICDAIFSNQNKLCSHYRQHIDMATYYRNEIDDNSLICYYCNVHFTRVADLEKHINVHTVTQSIFACQLCNYKNTDSDSIKKHLSSHGINPLVCNLCLLTFISGSKFRKHVKTHKPINRLSYSCDICKEKFLTRHEIRHHIPVHVNDLLHARSKSFALTTNEAEEAMKDSGLDNWDDIQIEINGETVGEKVITKKNKKKTNVELTNTYVECTFCFKKFSSEANLTLHSYACQIKTTNCGICCKNFSNTTLLKAHLNYEHSIEINNGEIQTCDICDAIFSDQNKLFFHYRLHVDMATYYSNEINDNSLICYYCNVHFTRVADLEKHINVHIVTQSIFACQLCDYKNTDSDSIKKHLSSHGINPLVCNLCLLTFISGRKFRKHVKTHKPINKLSYSCDICKEKFSTRHEIRHHITVHVKDLHTCKTCSKSFINLDNYESHKNEHIQQGKQSRSVLCSTCGKFFVDSFLSYHMMFHDDIRPFSCTICEKRCRTKAALKNHQLVHSDIRPHTCTFCGFSFKRSSDLTEHLRIHTNERPFSCTFHDCNAKFKTSHAMRFHIRAHTGSNKVYTCKVCNKDILKKSIKRHMFIHTNQRPHKCDVCDKRFKRIDHLTLHRAKIHSQLT